MLPRIQDVTHMVREVTEHMGMQRVKAPEFVLFDLQDAFCHWPVAKEELANCLAPSANPNKAILFRALLFGYKSAPLLMGRLSAVIGRMWQAMMEKEDGRLQIYIDDVLMILTGSDAERADKIALGLYTLKAFGVNIALRKEARGRQVQWIGVRIQLEWTGSPGRSALVYHVSKKMTEEVIQALEVWITKGMIAMRELRSVAGKLSWMAICPRVRWAVSVLFAVLKGAVRDEVTGEEDRRAAMRSDTRPKKGLVAVKRFGTTLRWIIVLLHKSEAFTLKTEPLVEAEVVLGIISDASPYGLGAMLVQVDPTTRALSIWEAMEAKVTKEEAHMLALEHGEASSQGPLEALALLRAVNTWKTELQDKPFFFRSDSVVALGMAKKLASSTPTLNFIAAELAIKLEQCRIPKVTVQHVPGVFNHEADWLSRPHQRSKEVPELLRKVKIKLLPTLKLGDFELAVNSSADHPWHSLPPHNVSVFESLGSWGSLCGVVYKRERLPLSWTPRQSVDSLSFSFCLGTAHITSKPWKDLVPETPLLLTDFATPCGHFLLFSGFALLTFSRRGVFGGNWEFTSTLESAVVPKVVFASCLN